MKIEFYPRVDLKIPVFRGYEVFLRYARLLLQYKKELPSQLASKQYKLFNDFDVQPVLNRSTLIMEYFENKRLNFLRLKDGALMGVNWRPDQG